MRILHVVTHTSQDGAFGGPTRVAFAQAEALARRGHDVTLLASAPKLEAGTRTENGVRIRTFPVWRPIKRGGFATMWPHGMHGYLVRNARKFDVAHIHLARDLTTLPATIILGARHVPYVTQSHGMIDASANPLASLLDAVATRRALNTSKSWLVLTESESADLRKLAIPTSIMPIRNGIGMAPDTPLADRADVVLFLARLHERKRPLAFVAMAKLLDSQLPTTRFEIIGPDEGEGPAVAAAIAEANMGDRLVWSGALPPALTSSAMSNARVYVLPSINEVFPMSMLESFAAGTPTVATSSLGIAAQCERYGAAILTDGSAEDLAQAVLSARTDLGIAEALRTGGRSFVLQDLNIDSISEDLERAYVQAGMVGR